MSDAPHTAFHPRGPAWLITVVVTMAPFMEILDSTIVNVCLPHIAGSLSSSYDEATWTLTSYLVANGIILQFHLLSPRQVHDANRSGTQENRHLHCQLHGQKPR